MLFFELRVQGVEFGDRGVDVLDVEPHQQCDPAFLIQAEQAKHLVPRRPTAHVRSAQLESRESQALTSRGDQRPTVTHHSHVVVALCIAYPFTGRNHGAGEADNPTATLNGDVGSQLPLDLVPIAAIESRVPSRDRAHALVVRLDVWRFGRSRGSREAALIK